MVLVLRLLSSAVNWHELLKLTHTADSTLMKYACQAFNRCRETARRPVLYLCYVPYLKNAVCVLIGKIKFYTLGDRTIVFYLGDVYLSLT